MKGSVFRFVPVLFCLTGLVKPIQGGTCWGKQEGSGLCKDILLSRISKEDCCQSFPDVTTAWSREDMDSGNVFYQWVAQVEVPCYPCKNSCSKVDCGPEKKCVVRSGRPKCVCSPCEDQEKKSGGPVCGSDEKTYRSVCQLKKRACRRRKSSLSVAYDGSCKSSCDQIKCPAGESCILDQNASPHCVSCAIRCPDAQENSRPVCGADGVTYPNVCILRQKACMSGKAIPEAYKGKCMANATCDGLRCGDHQTCLADASSGLPRCVTCSGGECRSGKGRKPRRTICGTNNKTYRSWCQMVRDACATGFVIETKFRGSCDQGDKTTTTTTTMTTSG